MATKLLPIMVTCITMGGNQSQKPGGWSILPHPPSHNEGHVWPKEE